MADMRLTKQLEDGQFVMDCQNCELKSLNMCTVLSCRNRLKDRLAEYENTAADVAPVRHGKIVETIENGRAKRVFTCCGEDFTNLTQWYIPDYCPN